LKPSRLGLADLFFVLEADSFLFIPIECKS